MCTKEIKQRSSIRSMQPALHGLTPPPLRDFWSNSQQVSKAISGRDSGKVLLVRQALLSELLWNGMLFQ